MQADKLTPEVDLGLNRSKILVVDDQPINIQTIYNILAVDYEVLAATSGKDAIQVCSENPPDLILLDVLMPGMNGLELCLLLKSEAATKDIPVIFVTSFNQQHEEDECWRSGGIDFITKPVNPMTLKNRVKVHLTLKFQKDMLLQMVYVDGLTSIFNRRYFDTHIDKISDQVKRSNRDTAVLLVDIDYFKLFNDNYGHVSGDETLKTVALTIRDTIRRPADFVSRYGGEEFVVVLPESDLSGALLIAEKIRAAIFAKKIVHEHSSHQFVSVSIGVSTILTSNKNQRSVTEDADANLYIAKDTGRNKVHSE